MNEVTIGEQQIVISKGTRHVSIWIQGNTVEARKFVGNADFALSDASPLSWKGKSVAGARKWAAKNID